MIMTEGMNARVKRVNVYTNAMGTMLIYTSFFAGTMLLPTVLKDLMSEQLIYYSMAVHSLTAAITCPFSMFIIKHFGAKISLIVGSICCLFFYLSVIVPNSMVIFVTQSIFGFGLALVRPASLKFLVHNSNPSSMGQDTGIHWGWFMSSMIWGNSITLLLTTHTPDPETLRMTVYSILGSLSLLGTLCYVFLRPTAGSISSNFDNERAALLDGMKEDLTPRSFGSLVKDTFDLVTLKQTLWLIPSMLAAGFYFTMYCVEIPTMIGDNLLLFGCMVGVGELVGSIVLGRLITVFGYVLVTILAGCLAIISLLLTYMTIPGSGENIDPPTLALTIAVAVAYGVSDAGNNTALSTIIGRLFSERSEVIFCVMSCVMNLAAMTWYFVYTVVAWETIIVVTGLAVLVSMIGIFIVVRPK